MKGTRRRCSQYGRWSASIAVKAAMAALKMRVGRRTRSAALTADAWHDLVDLMLRRRRPVGGAAVRFCFPDCRPPIITEGSRSG